MKASAYHYADAIFSRRKVSKITRNSVYILLTFNYKGDNIFSFYHFP